MRKEVHRRHSILSTDDNNIRMLSVELGLGDAGGCLDGQPTTGYTNRQRTQTPIKGKVAMAKKKPTDSALTNILNTSIELLRDAENAEDDGMISVSNSVYMRLRAAAKEATGVAYGIAVNEESEEEDEDEDDQDQFDEDDG
jgi:hypothetical protein